MTTSFFGQLVFESTFDDMNPEHELVYLGGEHLLDWVASTGAYRIFRIDIIRDSGGLSAVSPVREGVWAHGSWQKIIWLGGDEVMLWNPVDNTYSIHKYDRKMQRNNPFSSRAIARSAWTEPWKDLIYLGRGKLLCLYKNKPQYCICRREGNDFVPLTRPKPSSRTIRHNIRVAWLGGDRLAGWSTRSSRYTFLRFSNKIIIPRQLRRGSRGIRPAARWRFSDVRLVYLGRNHVLEWNPKSRAYKLWWITLRTDMPIAIEDYLELHTKVRDAILWEQGRTTYCYTDWGEDSKTRGLYKKLGIFYSNIKDGHDVGFTFSDEIDGNTNEARIAPRLYFSWMNTRDASELYLAQLAQYFWIEIQRIVPWRLHNYNSQELDTFFNSKNMFVETDNDSWTNPRYKINADESGAGTQTDPIKCYRFLCGNDPAVRLGRESFIKRSKRETIFAFTRWIRDHLRHGPNIVPGMPETISAYQYSGEPPIFKIFTPCLNPLDIGPDPEPHYWAWFGCHTAGALMVWVMRSVNIAARTLRTCIDNSGTLHTGIDFPAEKICSAHTDDLYAYQILSDPTIEPDEIYFKKKDYAQHKQKFTTPAPPDTDRGAEYLSKLAHIGLEHPTYWLVWAFWWDQFHTNSTQLAQRLSFHGYTDSQIAAAIQTYTPKFQSYIASFKTQHDLQNTSESSALAAYERWYDNWEKNR